MLKMRRKIMRKIIVKRGRQSKKGGSVTRPTSHRLTFPQLFCQNHPKAESQICATHFLLFFCGTLFGLRIDRELAKTGGCTENCKDVWNFQIWCVWCRMDIIVNYWANFVERYGSWIPLISCCFFFKKILRNTDWLLNYDWLSNTHIAHKNDHCGHFIP